MSYQKYLKEASAAHALHAGIAARDMISGIAIGGRQKSLSLFSFYMNVFTSIDGDRPNVILSKDDLEFMVRDINNLFGTSLIYNFQ